AHPSRPAGGRPNWRNYRFRLDLSAGRNDRFGSGSHHLEHVPIRVLEIEATAAVPVVDLHVAARARAAAIGDALALDAVEDRVEFRVADPERVMMAFELFAVVEIERQVLVDPDRLEMRVRPLIGGAKDAGEELRRGDLIVGGDDCV